MTNPFASNRSTRFIRRDPVRLTWAATVLGSDSEGIHYRVTAQVEFGRRPGETITATSEKLTAITPETRSGEVVPETERVRFADFAAAHKENKVKLCALLDREYGDWRQTWLDNWLP